MTLRTDLAAEQAGRFGEKLPTGVRVLREKRGMAELQTVIIETQQAAERMGKPIGYYYTVEGRNFNHSVDDSEHQIKAAAEVLGRLLPPQGLVLVVGLGNRMVTPDALGPLAADRVLATRHMEETLRAAARLRETAVLAPGVLPQTGLEAGEQVAWAVKETGPAAVVAVDALAAAESERLGRTIQISNVGIVPGSGVQGNHLPLTRQTLGTPVISMGVPMVIDASTFVAEYLRQVGVEEEVIAGRNTRPLMVTPHDVDLVVRKSARCVALALNMALQPELTPQEIRALTE